MCFALIIRAQVEPPAAKESMKHFIRSACLAGLSLVAPAVEFALAPLIHDGDRLVFVGDSITGQSMNAGPGGFAHLVQHALNQARPGNGIEIIALGGSGQGVGSWQGILASSAKGETMLDVPNVDVRATLAKPVGVLVIMLGMNDSLSPYIRDDEMAVEAWATSYRTLINGLRDRARPRVIALGTVTPNSEDETSPKNRLIAKLNQRLVSLAKEVDAIVVPNGESMREVLARGRACRPDFHVTYDFVHPNPAGHAGIAYGMLAGLGETAAAAVIATTVIEPLLAKERESLPSLAYTLQATLPSGSDQAELAFAWNWNPAAGAPIPAHVNLDVPAGWTTESAGQTIRAMGPLTHLVTHLALHATDGRVTRTLEVPIPAPWLVGHGFTNVGMWARPDWHFAPESGRLPGEADFMRGIGLGSTPAGWQESPPVWCRYLASVGQTGGATSGNLNLFAIDYSPTFAAAFAARWIRSDRERAVQVMLDCSTFAGSTGLQVALGGVPLYSGVIDKEARRPLLIAAKLHPGWNALVVKAGHVNWKFQASIDLQAAHPGDLDELEISTIPK